MEIAALAHHLALAAHRHPQAPGLVYAGRCLSLSDLHQSLLATIKVTTRRTGLLSACGSRRFLFEQTLLASAAGRPFWPQEHPTPACAPPLPGAALLISTSGTEGPPKVVQLGLKALNHAATASNARMPIVPGELWLHCLPLHHIGGQMILWRCLTAGAGICLLARFDLDELRRCLNREAISHLSLVPAMLAKLLDNGVAPPSSLRHVLIGGAPLSNALFERGIAAGWPLHPGYGMSETAAQIAAWSAEDGPWQTGLAGRPLAGSEIRIAPDGRIEIRGDQRMLGYLGQPALTPDAWFTTSDTGEIDPVGRLHVHGRADDMLISGGRNIHPQEIENALSHHPLIEDIAVTGLPDPIWGDRIMALYVGNLPPEALSAYADAHLPSALRPRAYRALPALPRNTTGKLIRAALRTLAMEAA